MDGTVAFCGLRCLSFTIAHHLEPEQANRQASAGNDLFARLGHGRPALAGKPY